MLFGHQTNDDNGQIPDTTINEAAASLSANPLAADSATGASLPATSQDNTPSDDTPGATSPFDTPQADVVMPSAPPAIDDALSDETSAPPAPAPVELSDTDVTQAPVSEVDGDLLALKQQALGELTPLVDHLDQTPEEKFRTTMMMIQSTDNQALLKEAYAAAQAIPDEKLRAQALLDVINEINYFTQQK